MSEERITRVSLKQARKMKGETDWERVRALTDEDIERAVAEDPDQSFWTDEDWANARVVWPQGKEPVTLRLDRDILAWFKQRGRGYQTRINAVLRAFVEAQKVGAVVRDFNEGEYERTLATIEGLLADEISKRSRTVAEKFFDVGSIGLERYSRLYEKVLNLI